MQDMKNLQECILIHEEKHFGVSTKTLRCFDLNAEAF